MKVERANVYIENGVVHIDTVNTDMYSICYDVEWGTIGNVITVIAYRPQYTINSSSIFGDRDIIVDNLIDEDVEYKNKYWFFGSKVKVAKRGWVEYKERIKVTYTANNWLIKT